jgi:hypothetical protein
MFRSLHAETRQPIIILDAKWTEDIGRLRELGRTGRLVCPGCDEPVRVRAGEVRRWHFAHKHRQNCPLSHESAAVARAKAVLYPWLRSKYKEALTFEKNDGDADLPRPVDFYVPTGSGGAVYWIIDTAIRPDERHSLRMELERVGSHVNWLFTEETLAEGDESGTLDLTTTEREFRSAGRYDKPYAGSSLHYLLSEPDRIRTYRDLQIVHKPQRFRGSVSEHPVDDMLILRSTGEIVHPGDHERLRRYHDKIKRQSEEAQGAFAGEVSRGCRSTSPKDPDTEGEQTPRSWSHEYLAWRRAKKSRASEPGNPSTIICKRCGKETTQWTVRDGQTGYGECRECVYSDSAR